MDPRHPELAVARIKELIEQYDRIEKEMGETIVSARLAQLEREGGLVVQEICLVAPRIHEAMMQSSRQRRRELSRGVVEKPVEKPVVVEKLVETELDKEVNEILKPLEKPKKKTTRKKKTTKKADK